MVITIRPCLSYKKIKWIIIKHRRLEWKEEMRKNIKIKWEKQQELGK
jgi:hypothetical protein